VGARCPQAERAVLALVPSGLPRVRERRSGKGRPKEAGALAEELPGTAEINAMEVAPLSSASNVDQGYVRALAATVRALEQQIAGLSRRVEELSRGEHYVLDPGAAR
jgi:hypothetical protein